MAIRGGKERDKVTAGVIMLIITIITLPFMLIGKLLSWFIQRNQS